MQDEGNDGKHQKQVDKGSSHMEYRETTDPGDQ
jgi:hypothetical protein